MIKKVSTILLVLVAIAGVTAAVYRQSRQSAATPATQSETSQAASTVASAAAEPAAPKPETAGPVVLVTYFTTSVRCASCMRIEELTQKAVATRFAAEVDAGRVAFRMIYIDTPATQHYIEDYQLVSKSVVVSESLDGREQDWINLQDVWLLLRDEQAFVDYVAGAVSAYL